ncbi:hypothetical protein BD410DRAFT_788493 [Rickenella mellea]|uniref:Uncharacterized protein n=1 Tax=Rickenella mellea TaxID=50990 RepID=A0A4Y7Q5H9_9AGAM|nr:hypothetical protein BD410DRAFT_788493 [Rickenella mellea]
MRCEGPDNPPCSRCKLAGTECVFEKVIKTEADTPTSVELVLSFSPYVYGLQLAQVAFETSRTKSSP